MARKMAGIAPLLLLLTGSLSALGVAPAQATGRVVISGLSPASGPVGTEVLVSGDHLRGTKSVSFNGTAATAFRVLSRRELRATVPAGATTGPVSVSRRSETATSSESFDVETTADLSLHVDQSSNPVVAGTPLTYTVVLTNAGPDPATSTTIVDALPAEAEFGSATDGGSYDQNAGSVTWDIGTLESGASVSRELAVRPIHPELPMSNVVSATTFSLDPGSPNAVETDTTVDPEPGVHYVAVRDGGLTPRFHRVALDAHGLGLLDTGMHSPIDTYRFTFDQSAEIRTSDLPAFPLNNGKLVVPVQVGPASGGETTTFTVTWALTEPPPGLAEDIQIKRPGAGWSHWQHNETTTLQAPFTPDAGPGTYSFRSRMRNPSQGTHSRFGPPISITVS